MSTGNPRRDARISIIGLGVLALFGLAAVAYIIDRWLIGGLITHQVAAACQSAIRACAKTVSPFYAYFPQARIFIAALSLGALLFAGIKAAGILYFAKRIKTAEGRSIDLPERIKKLACEIGAGEVPVRYIETETPIAYTDGLWRPSVHLSKGLAESLDDNQLKGVLAHEYAHVSRRDNLTIFAALALRDFLFIFPLSHLFFGNFMKWKEHAADDLAAELTGDPVGLADAIVKVARIKGSSGRHCPAYATFFPDKAGVRDRVTRLLGHAHYARRGVAKLLLAGVLTAVIIGFLAGIATAQMPKPRLSKECQQKPVCVKQGGACCIN